MLESNNVNLVKYPRLIVAAIILGVILNPLNTTMITVALPAIQHAFQLSSKDISLLISSYFIVSAIFLPLAGKLSDHYGRKKIFLSGLILVSLSSLLAPLSPNMLFLLGMRTIQAIGTSALFPAGIGIVRTYINKNQNRVIATIAVFSTTSAALGPTISGLLIQNAGWSVIFYVNFPIIITSAILAFVCIPNDKKQAMTPFKWDVIGILLFSLLLTCWMVFLQSLENGFNVVTFMLTIFISLLFYHYEKRKKEPFINVLFLTKNPKISFVYLQFILVTLIFFALILSMPTYLQKVMMLDSKSAGIMLLSISMFAMLMTPIATRWIEKAGFRIPLMCGAIVGILGVGLLFAFNQSSNLLWVFIVLSITGISNGALSIGTQNSLYSIVSKEQSGISSGLLQTSRFIGNILASSLYGVMFATGVTDANKNSISVVLLIVSLFIIPTVLYITKKDKGI
ncbi:MFS transporter [Lysinibacillus sp. NPDC097195]|uniref:MFS transporter n=1 Tax=Lysinibacillus sp. NPDC097195 TaxID=3364141 RepID=UPI0037F2B82C